MNANMTAETNLADETQKVKSLLAEPAGMWAIAAVTQLPLLSLYMIWLWRFEHYQYVPFLIAAVAYLAYLRLPAGLRYPTNKFAILCFILSYLSLGVGCVLFSPWFGAVSFLLIAASFLATHQLLYLCVPLLLVVRIPLGYDSQLVSLLQTVTTRISSFLLDLLAVPHFAMGNVIELPDRQLFVADACSGIQSAFTIACVALLVVAARKRRLILVPGYLAMALIWAILGNTIRVTSIAFAAYHADVDLSQGWAHDAIGYATLLIAILLTLSTDSLFAMVLHSLERPSDFRENPFVYAWQTLFADSDTRYEFDGYQYVPRNYATDETPVPLQRQVTPAAATASTERFWSRYHKLILPAMLGMAALLAFPLLMSRIYPRRVQNAEGEVLIEPSLTLLNDFPGLAKFEHSKAVRLARDPNMGMNYDQWEMTLGPTKGMLVFSQPYPEWHDLNICYSSQGWNLISKDLIQPSATSTDRTQVAISRFNLEDGTFGYLLFTGLKEGGDSLSPPGASFFDILRKRLDDLVNPKDYQRLFTGDTAMLQVWIPTKQELSGGDIAELAETLATARAIFARELSKASKPKP